MSEVNGSALSRLWWLARKEGRELAASRAVLLVALITGPLVGQAFGTAVRAYGEASGSAGGAAALSQGLSPLDGFVVPVFGAYALIATLLLPFVAIRHVSNEKSSGALALLVQGETSLPAMLAVKLVVLTLAWVACWIPGLVAFAIWRSFGGHLYAPETLTVLAGHLTHGVLVIVIAFLAAAVTDGASSAAVVALAVTLGAWALDFVASVQGGIAARLAQFTPEAMLRVYEHGELDLRVLLVWLTTVAALFVCAATFLQPGRSRSWRALRAGIAAVVTALMLAIVASMPARHTSTDLSEDARNSVSPEHRRALSRVPGVVHVTANLGAQDPRLADLQRNVLHPIGRELAIDLRAVSATSTGMFERQGSGYGEVWYEWNGRREMTRSTTLPIVLETIYRLTGQAAPAAGSAAAYSGYPLVAEPGGSSVLFYAGWPALVLLFMWWRQRSAPPLDLPSD